NSSTLLGTFFCKNLSSYSKSAGNYHFINRTITSETICKTSCQNFSAFHALYAKLEFSYSIPDNWLSWFVGFSEGDGAILSYNGRPLFVLTQKEELILQHILSVLGFGTIRKIDKKGTIFYRYIVEDFTGVLLLALIFNGNLAIPNRVKQLDKWLSEINLKLSTKGSRIYGLCSTIVPSTCLFKPSLNNAWLSGFTDAEGCFNVNITKRENTLTGYRVILRYVLDQKYALDELTYISSLFGYGKVIIRSTDMYRYYCNSIIGLVNVCNYFKSFPLKTKKSNSLANWLKVYKMVLNKEHLTTEGLEMIRVIKKTINPKN
ncbi:hypothetical protein POSPLADRAFT_1160876, partial [Postia placenta MAD-698-R-SB12]